MVTIFLLNNEFNYGFKRNPFQETFLNLTTGYEVLVENYRIDF